MAKTQKGKFDLTYHHINAPTLMDEKIWNNQHQRILTSDKWSAPEFDILQHNSWEYQRKLDGENIRIYWNGEQCLWNGKTNNYNCSADFENYMNKTFLEEIFEEKFGRDKEVYIFGEHMGPKVQGNELGLTEDKIFIYDVMINGVFLDNLTVTEIASYFNIKSIPYAFETLSNLITECQDGGFKKWEGIVATPLGRFRNLKGERIICKIKNKDYLRKEK